jgi:hypothetical protein
MHLLFLLECIMMLMLKFCNEYQFLMSFVMCSISLKRHLPLEDCWALMLELT